MTIEFFRPTSLAELVEFIKNPINDIDQMWIYKNQDYLGSLLPKIKGLHISYTNEQVTMVLYIKKDENIWESELNEEMIIMNDIAEYSFHYV
jgi:hypothetical protein